MVLDGDWICHKAFTYQSLDIWEMYKRPASIFFEYFDTFIFDLSISINLPTDVHD